MLRKGLIAGMMSVRATSVRAEIVPVPVAVVTAVTAAVTVPAPQMAL